MSNSVPNISAPSDLAPERRFFPEVGEHCINIDGAIKLMQAIDTPQAKHINRVFRLKLSQVQISNPEMTTKKQRETAFLSALEQIGMKQTFINLDEKK